MEKKQVIKSILIGFKLFLVFVTLSSCSKSSVSPSSQSFNIGSSYKGGIIFYIFKTSDPGYVSGEIHGLIVGEDIQGTFPWGCNNINHYALTNDVGSGDSDTDLIISICSGTNASLAARTSEWYLPNLTEILKLYANRSQAKIDLSTNYYWTSYAPSSSQQQAYSFRFADGNADIPLYSTLLRVKPIKKF